MAHFGHSPMLRARPSGDRDSFKLFVPSYGYISDEEQ